MGFLVEQYRLFLIALQRYGCLRAPDWVNDDPSDARPAIRYFPLVGLLTGILCALIYIAAARWFPPAVAVLLAMACSLLLTRAVHERDLNGTAIALLLRNGEASSAGIAVSMVLLLKFASLTYLQDEWIVAALICGHALSRFAALPLVVVWGRRGESSTDPWIGPGEFLVAGFYGLLPLVAIVLNRSLEPQMHGPLLIGAGAAFAGAALTGGALYRRTGRIGAQGLGAVQQLAEVGFYLGLLISPH